jgi:acyl-coenzyme A synthetase/AMP-(fatty) acid ligase
VTFTNLYGPTEATIASSYYRMPRCPQSDTERIPIGTACAGEELLVLDEALRPVPAGEIGDLYIRGKGLSPGYWLDPDKTAAAFLPNPFATGPGDRIYKTGDLASIDEDGLFYLHGRKDSQIKSRGYRIELGEIETVLRAAGEVADCAVVAFESPRFDGATIACAYVSPAGRKISAAELKSSLTLALPAYMIPARWLELNELPLNANGKVDRPLLRQRFANQDAPAFSAGKAS